MKEQEVLDILGLGELPVVGQPKKNEKCIALVQRTTGRQDYVITRGGGVITDIGYKSSIVKIVEYYPTPKKEAAPEPEKVEVVEVVEEKKPIPQQEPVLTQNHIEKQKPEKSKKLVAGKFNRFETIKFLETQNVNKKSLLRKSDKQLQELMDGFKK